MAAIKSPLTPGDQGQISNDGRAALVTFQITGNPDTAKDRVGAALAATAAVQRAYPGLFVGELGDASAQKAVNASISSSFRQAEVTSLPITLVILVLAFGALIAAGVPLLLGFTDSSCRATPGESSKPPLPSPSTNQRESQVPASLPECCRFRPQAVTRPR